MSEDLTAPLLDRREQLASAATSSEFDALIGDTKPATPTPPPAEQQPVSSLSLGDALKKAGTVADNVASDVAKGVVESPRAIVTGVRDAYQNTISMGRELGGWLEQNNLGGGVIIDKGGVRLASGKELSNPDLVRPADYANLPHLMDNPQSVTGGLIKGTAQFLVGMKGAGKLADLAGVPEVSGAAAYGLNAVKGAISSFAAFDPHQKRLSDLIQQFPILQNPVSEYLSSNPDDNAAEGRFKNAIEGVGMGVLTDGFVRGVRLLRSAMQGKAVATAAMDTVPRGTSSELEPILSAKPDSVEPPPVVVQPGVRAAEKLAAATTRTEALAPEDVVGRMVAPLEPIDSSAAGRAMEPPKTFINFGRIDTPEDVQRAMQGLSDAVPLNPDTAKAGVRSFADMKLDAAHQNAWDALVARQSGQPLGDSQMLAARQLWSSATDKVAQLAQEAATSPSEANLFAFRKMLAVHSMIQNEVLGARAATARSMASMRIPVGSSAEQMRNLQMVLDQNGGTQVARELAQAVDGMARTGMISELTVAAEKGAFARTVDAAKEAWTLGLLTSPKTHLRNIISNAAFVPMQMAERATAGQYGQLLGDESGVQVGEASAQYFGMQRGIADMFRYYAKRARAGIAGSDADVAQVQGENPIMETGLKDATKLDLKPAAISSEALKIPTDSWLGKGADALGSVYGVTSKALTAEDDFFKVLAWRMETHAQAFRQAQGEIRNGTLAADDAASRMTDLIQNPPENIRLQAADQTLYQTFNQAPGWFGQMLLKAKRESLFAHMLVPFARTTANLQHAAFERTPLAPLVGQWRADFAAGGARQQLAIARWTLGSMATMAIIDAASSGLITGRGPVAPGERQAMAREGWGPYSVKVGDRWFQYNGISPVGDILGMGADLSETSQYANDQIGEGKDFEKTSAAMVAAIAGNILNKSYLSGFANAVDALHDPNGGGAEMFIQQLAGSTVPAGVNVVTKAMDPNVRAVNSMTDAIRARLPGLSKDLPPRHDLWGEPMVIDSGFGKPFDLFSPVFSKKPSEEPIDQELLRLHANIEMPPASVTFNQGGIGVPVNLRQYPAVYERYVQLAGNELKNPAWNLGAKDLLNQIVEGNHPLSAVYNLKADAPQPGTSFIQVSPKEEFIRSIIGQYRELARNQILKEYPDIAGVVDDRREQLQQLKMPVLQ